MSYSHESGSAGTVTVPAGMRVHCWATHAAAGGAGGTAIFTPGDTGVACDTIPVPAGCAPGYTFPDNSPARPGHLGPGSTLVFAGTDLYFVILVPE
jgi:hypothetical protein